MALKPARVDFVIYKGSTFRQVFLIRSTAGVPLDLTGSTIRSKIRKSYTSTVEVNFNASITDQVNGVCQIYLSDAATEDLQFSHGVYDVEIVFSNGDVNKVLFGNIIVRQEATYA